MVAVVEAGVVVLVAGFESGVRRWGRSIVLSMRTTTRRKIDARSRSDGEARSGSEKRVVRPSFYLVLTLIVTRTKDVRFRCWSRASEPCELKTRAGRVRMFESEGRRKQDTTSRNLKFKPACVTDEVVR